MLRKILPPVAMAAGAFFLVERPGCGPDRGGRQPSTNRRQRHDQRPRRQRHRQRRRRRRRHQRRDGRRQPRRRRRQRHRQRRRRFRHLEGGDGNDTLNGGEDDDFIEGDDGNDTINGGDGDDTLEGDDGNDTINGDAGRDFINGDDGDDTINGGTGDDVIAGDDESYDFGGPTDCGGGDTINGDAGDDWISGEDNFCEAGTVTATAAVAGSDCAGDDLLNGGADDDVIFGERNDCEPASKRSKRWPPRRVSPEAGDDVLNGGDGDDYLIGDDNYCYLLGGNALVADDACAGDDTLNGGGGDDFLIGDDNYCAVYTDEEIASFLNCVGDDILDGGDGDDILYGENFFGIIGGEGVCFSNFNSVEQAAAIEDPTIFEFCVPGGNDTLNGGNGDDELYGATWATTSSTAAPAPTSSSATSCSSSAASDSSMPTHEGQDIDDLIDFLVQLDDEELTAFLLDMYFFDAEFGGGEDEVAGNAGVDVVVGGGGPTSSAPTPTTCSWRAAPAPTCRARSSKAPSMPRRVSVTIDLGTGILLSRTSSWRSPRAVRPTRARDPGGPDQGHPHNRRRHRDLHAECRGTGTDFFEYAIRRRIVAARVTSPRSSAAEPSDRLCLDNPGLGSGHRHRRHHHFRPVGLEADHPDAGGAGRASRRAPGCAARRPLQHRPSRVRCRSPVAATSAWPSPVSASSPSARL